MNKEEALKEVERCKDAQISKDEPVHPNTVFYTKELVKSVYKNTKYKIRVIYNSEENIIEAVIDICNDQIFIIREIETFKTVTVSGLKIIVKKFKTVDEVVDYISSL